MKINVIVVGFILSLVSSSLAADSVSLLLHGRAEIVGNLIDPNLQPDARLEKLEILKRSQMNLEQIVVRDADLDPRDSRNKRLFADFERNFLVHSSHEASRSLGEHWFHTIGLSSHAVRNATVGRR